MAIEKRTNKFDNAVAEIDEQEREDRAKAEKVVKALTGNNKPGSHTKTIVDKNGKERCVRVNEKRKALPVYMPESLYEKYSAINSVYGRSNSSATVALIWNYVNENKGVLKIEDDDF